jgi:hypothetical protein
MSTTGEMGIGALLEPRLIRHDIHPYRVHWLHIPGMGRVAFTRDEGDASIPGAEYMQTLLTAHHFDGDGKLKHIHDLGSGLVQDNLVQALAADALGTTTNKAAPILANSGKYMYSGTGSTANAYDYQLATTAGPASGAVTPTLGVSADNSTLQYVGTINYASTLAITEWGLFNTNSQGAAYSASSFSTVSTTTVTPTTAPSWTANAWAGYIAVDTSAATKVGAFILSNTTTALTINGWYDLTSGGGAGTTPATTDTIGIYPLMSDHKTFAVINVVSGDSIQFTYTLTINSGG